MSTLAEDLLDTDDRRLRAMIEKDVSVLREILMDNLTYAHTNGVVDSKGMLIEKIRLGTYKYLTFVPHYEATRIYGDAAVVTGTATMGLEIQGRPLDVPIRFTEIYVRKLSRWRMAAWQSTRIS